MQSGIKIITKQPHFHSPAIVAPALHPLSTTNFLFSPPSHATLPPLSTLKNLYSKLIAAFNGTVIFHTGFASVYPSALNAFAAPVSQFPSSGIEPTSLMVCPTTVLTLMVNVMEGVGTAVAQAVVGGVEVEVEVMGLVERVVGVGGVEPWIAISAHPR